MTEPEKIKSLFQALLEEQPHTFPPKTQRVRITCNHGNYIIFDPAGHVSHVGNSIRGIEGLCQRLQDHVSGGSSFCTEYLKPKGLTVRDGFTFKFMEVPDARDRALLQALAIGVLCPQHIGTGVRAK